MSGLASLGGQWLLLMRALGCVLRGEVKAGAVLALLHEFAGRSLLLVTGGLAAFGVVIVSIADAQARRLIGNLAVLGPAYFELLLRELGPMAAALLAASRTAALTSAELAAMAVNEQVEALEMSAADPVAVLVAPRVVASAIALPVLCLLGTAAALVAAALAASLVFGSDGAAFVDPRFIGRGDVLCASVKALLFGLFIPVAASSRGLRASGGAPAVGEAVTRGVVDACLGCLVIDFAVGWAFLAADL